LITACVVAVFAGLLAPQAANATCMVTTSGVVNCNAGTITTNSTNLNGINPLSSDRQQVFDNGAAINGTIKAGVSLSGFGLELIEGAATPLPVIMSNQGQVTQDKSVDALRIDGNGGPILYFGDGSIINAANRRAALFVDNVGNNVFIATGAGEISGATGIHASSKGAGAVTIRTGSGLVTGTANNAISGSTVNGPLTVTIGSGGVTTSGHGHAIDLTSNSDILVKAEGNVSGFFNCTAPKCRTGGVRATSTGNGNIVVAGSGTYSVSGGRAIYAHQGATGLGGILITGSGPTLNGGFAGFANAGSAIRAEITNPDNSNNIIVNRAGNITSTNTFPAAEPLLSVSSDIHAFTLGTGNIIVATGAGATVLNAGVYGINVYEGGKGSTGSINISTGAFSKLTANGTGIFANNWATAIPASAASKINVTANGTINSGATVNLVGKPVEGGGSTTMPAGILAGYNGGPVFSAASTAPYTSCGPTGCTTLTPNPKVNGTVAVINNATINAAGGDGIFAFNFGNGDVSVRSTAPITVTGTTAQNGIEAFSAERGNLSVVTLTNVTGGNGNGISTNSAGEGTTTINVLGGTTEGAVSGVSATSSSGPIQITNSGTIQNISGLAGDLAVATSGRGDATLINNARGVVTGTVSMTGGASNSFINAGIWNTLGSSTFAGSSSINNRGTIGMFGPTTFSGVSTLTNSGTLNLAWGTAVGTLAMPGNLVFQSSALYVAPLNVTASRKADIGGSASLAGTVHGALLPLPFSKQTTILHADGGLSGTTFSGFTTPPGFTGALTYTPTDVISTLTANLGASAGLSSNQQNVVSAINNFFNNGGTLPGAFAPVFALSGGSLANARSQLSGETATATERAVFQLTTEFLQLMLDPFVNGRGNVGGAGIGAIGFAPEAQASLPPDVALAYASILTKAPPKPAFEQHWTAWGSAYGGSNNANGNAGVGSNDVTASTFGFGGGMDYHLSSSSVVGFALAGAGTNWDLANALGAGRSDALQVGTYGMSWFGPAYVAGALAFANHWFTTSRLAPGDQLTATFVGQSYGARVESGYRFPVLPMLGVTPYGALQFQDFHTPAYSESDVPGGGLGLSYNAMNATDVRSELGSRFDAPTLLYGKPLVLYGRLAWAHDFVSNPALSASFETLPTASFTVFGAPIPRDSALTTAGVQLFLSANWSLITKFDSEFASGSQIYAGSGTLRYTW
jgi:uncharacterized protein with beta-barrel porin domain